MCRKIFATVLCLFLIVPTATYGSQSQISAKSAVVMDSYTNYVFYEHYSDLKLPIASTTKIMTCLLACELGDLNDVVTVTEEMLYATEGSLIYLKSGDKICLGDLIKGALLASGNDAANVIAFHIGKNLDGFKALMNRKAAEIGMRNTNFETPSGLEQGNPYSTAYDLALLACEAVKNPLFLHVCRMQCADIVVNNKITTIYNHNKLLSYDKNFCGVKTGFTTKAGRCLVSAYNNDGAMIIIVTLNAPDDWNDHIALKNYALQKYKRYNEKKNLKINVVGGKLNSVKCEYNSDFKYIGNISKQVYFYPFIYAPVYCGTVIGKVDYYCDGIKKESVEITASESVGLWETTK